MKRLLIVILALLCLPVAAAPKLTRKVHVASLAFTPDGRALVVGSQDRLVMHAVPSLKPLRDLPGHLDAVMGIGFTRDGKRMATASMDRTVRLWEVATGQPIAKIGPLEDDVLAVSFTPDGKRLAASTYNGVTSLFTLPKTAPDAKLQGHVLSVSPDGRLLASASVDGKVCLYALPAGRKIAEWTAHKLCINGIAFSPDGKRLATSSEQLRVWDVATHRQLADLDCGKVALNRVSWRPDGKAIAVASVTRGGFVWTRAADGEWTRQAIPHGPRVSVLAYSDDGKLAFWGPDNGLVLLDKSLKLVRKTE
ncbi:MAG: WD40 repeat domain-containing protein [Armatimonadetes bacterium]|nr:WD40 repeat domain-containing protein [Armatimonadota bacterium]